MFWNKPKTLTIVAVALMVAGLVPCVRAELVARYEFDGSADNSVGPEHGTLMGGAEFVTDPDMGSVLILNGTGDYVEFSDILVTTTEFTITAWANVLGPGGGRHHSNPIFSQRDNTGSSLYDVSLVNLYAHITNDDTKAGAEVRSSAGPMQYTSSASTETGEWHHYALRVNSQTITFYLDGAPVVTADNLQTGDYSTSIDYVNIGRHRYVKPGTGEVDSGLFNGMIDDVRIYDQALSSAEIGDIYSGLNVSVDIRPTSCPNPLNVRSNGVLPVAILGSDSFDVTTIDAASIRLKGVGPIRHSFEDVAAPGLDVADCNCIEDGPDGFVDLTLKFKTQEIVEVLGEVEHGDVITLELTGVLFGEIPIEGADCILIRGRHRPIDPADINKDGVVNAADFAIFAQNWLQSSIVDD